MAMLGLDYFRIVIVGGVKFFGVKIKKCRKEARVLARTQIMLFRFPEKKWKMWSFAGEPPCSQVRRGEMERGRGGKSLFCMYM